MSCHLHIRLSAIRDKSAGIKFSIQPVFELLGWLDKLKLVLTFDNLSVKLLKCFKSLFIAKFGHLSVLLLKTGSFKWNWTPVSGHCFVKARYKYLPTDNFLAEVVTCGSLAWAVICRGFFSVIFFTRFVWPNLFYKLFLKIIVIDSRKLSKNAVTWNQVAVNQFSHPKVERTQEKPDKERLV